MTLPAPAVFAACFDPVRLLDLFFSCAHYDVSKAGRAEFTTDLWMANEKGLLIVYTGSGKGKTTCALGAAFRAIGQGLRVLMVQFIKGSWHYGELDTAKMLGDDKIEIRPMGRGFVKVGPGETDPEDVRMCREAWEFSREQIQSGKYGLVILDEINYVIGYKMLDAEPVIEALARRPEHVHVICTGRNAHPKLIELADLVTEMREIKHPFSKGILAQRGIDY
jgi:cob(I)alamin adenosyltransferase